MTFENEGGRWPSDDGRPAAWTPPTSPPAAPPPGAPPGPPPGLDPALPPPGPPPGLNPPLPPPGYGAPPAYGPPPAHGQPPAYGQPPSFPGSPVFGTDHGTPYAPARVTTSGVAIAALIVGLLSFLLPFIGSLVAVILGVIALIVIRRPGSMRKGTVLAILGIGLGVLSSVAWIALVTSDSFRESFQEGLEEAGRASSSEALLDVGDCLDMSVEDSDNFAVSTDDIVACDELHTAEYAGSATLPGADGDTYPGENAVFEQAVERCLDIFADYTGDELATRADLDVFVEYPRPLSWRLVNDRQVGCYIIDIDGGPLQGSVRGG